MLSDEQIIQRALNGSDRDFRELMRRHQGAVYRLAFRMLNVREEAEDAVQDTFVRVYQNLGGYSEQGRLWQWIRRIAVNVCLRKLRREEPREDAADLADESQPLCDIVGEEVIRRIEIETVRKAISELPGAYRAAMVLRYQQDLSDAEIAELIGEPVGTVQVRLHRARKMLAQRLAGTMNDGMHRDT